MSCGLDVVLMKIIICKTNYLDRDKKHACLINTLINKMREYFNIDIQKKNIIYDEEGKPHIINNIKRFSFSYSDEFSVIAISDYDIGIDIEKLRQYDEKIVKRLYSKNEFNFINSSNNKDYEYTKLWTYKEAFVKHKGTGIDKNFSKLNFIDDNGYNNNLFKTIDYMNYIITVCSEDSNMEVEVIYDE